MCPINGGDGDTEVQATQDGVCGSMPYPRRNKAEEVLSYQAGITTAGEPDCIGAAMLALVSAVLKSIPEHLPVSFYGGRCPGVSCAMLRLSSMQKGGISTFRYPSWQHCSNIFLIAITRTIP